MPLLRHAGLALAISFGLSVLFWLGLGVFGPTSFWLASLSSAILGLAFGYFIFRKLLMTAIATVLVRVTIFMVVMMGNPPLA
jgi:hypothetical protein